MKKAIAKTETPSCTFTGLSVFHNLPKKLYIVKNLK